MGWREGLLRWWFAAVESWGVKLDLREREVDDTTTMVVEVRGLVKGKTWDSGCGR